MTDLEKDGTIAFGIVGVSLLLAYFVSPGFLVLGAILGIPAAAGLFTK